jgi:2-keto-3-deoxy-galactonokinase
MREPLITEEQKRMLNAACGDLAAQVRWHGFRMAKDDWRHFLCGTVMGWRMMPGYDRGQGAPGFVMLGGSSLKLTKAQATEAIEMAFHIGDHPEEQGLTCKPVDWCLVIKLARGIPVEEAA